MPETESVVTHIAGRELKVTNLAKVLYPLVGFTKGQVIDYYARIAPYMLPHVTGRGITFKRWPDGVTSEPFFNKRCPKSKPSWIPTAKGPGGPRGIDYCQLDEVAALVWAANLAALELHAPMARSVDEHTPTMVVFDLDPGKPASIIECAQVAMAITDVVGQLGLQVFGKTSGSKGMQLYLPVNTPCTHAEASEFAFAIAKVLEQQLPGLVTSNMARAERSGKVFIDWSQNSRSKTTIAAYSLRGKDRPTVSTPLTADETSDCADGEPLSFDSADVLERVEELGDLFAPTATLQQELPGF